MSYSEEEFLQLSGLQHFKFCRRQWALIHIEQQWAENFRTVDGALMHENAHDSDFRESRGDLLITRGISVFSPTLGISGQCDVLEYHRGSAGIPIRGKEGLWQPYPVEYKRGSPREDTGDTLQLCGQRERSTMEKSAAECRCYLQKSCDARFGSCLRRCTTCTGGATPQK